MSSTTSSSSPTLAQLIDQIVNTEENAPGFDLQQLVATIDTLLHHYNNNQQKKRSNTREKINSVASGMPSASNASKFSEGVSENVKIIASQISDYSGDKHPTSIDVLKAVGNIHWVGVGFLLVAAVIETMDTLKYNQMERLSLLNSMNDLAKVIMRLQPLPRLNQEMQAKMKDSIHLIVKGAILCCSQKKRGKVESLYNNGHFYLIYEYAEHDSLDKLLHNFEFKTRMSRSSSISSSVTMSWNQRIQTSFDVFSGLQYLHNYANPPNVQKDI